MTSPRDPFELLRSMRPPSDDEVLRRGDDPAADALFDRIVGADEAPRRKRRRGRRFVGGALALMVVTGGSAVAAVWLTRGEPTVIGFLSCWESAEFPPQSQWESRHVPGESPIESCRVPWTNGAFSTEGPPPMVACITSDGVIAVIPTNAAGCKQLGYELFQSSPEVEQAVADVDDLNSRLGFLDDGCFDEPSTREFVAEILAEDRYDGWTAVDGELFSAERPCGEIVVDANAETVTILGIPRPPAMPPDPSTDSDSPEGMR